MATIRSEHKQASNQRWRIANRDYLAAYEKTRNQGPKRRFKARAYYWVNKDEVVARVRLSKYGINKEQYIGMLQAQGGVCKICKEPETRLNLKSNKPFALSVDHCHASGKVRGLLCMRCNSLLGVVKDNPLHLRDAAAYLEGRS